MRILCLDFGEKRIGVAVSDPTGMLACPLNTIDRRDIMFDAQVIAKCCAEFSVDLILIGLPLDSEGEEGIAASKVREFAKLLKAKLKELDVNVEFEFWDESHSTIDSNKRMIDAGLGRKKRRRIIDRVAAASILQDYLDNCGEKRNV